MSKSVRFGDIATAGLWLAGVAHKTPVLTSKTVNQLVKSEVFFKCENFQRTGSFKFRGAYNALAQLSDAQKRQGVLAYSSGNHASAIALSGQLLGIPTTVVMPNDAPSVKQAATKGYGAQVLLYNRSEMTREDLAQKLINERQLTFIPPFGLGFWVNLKNAN